MIIYLCRTVIFQLVAGDPAIAQLQCSQRMRFGPGCTIVSAGVHVPGDPVVARVHAFC